MLNGSPLVKEDTRAKVLAAIEELGYRRNNAARMLATNRSGRIGMISAHLALHGPSMIAVSVQEAGHAAGYDVSLVGVSDFSASSPCRAPWTVCWTKPSRRSSSPSPTGSATEQVLSLDLPVPVVLVQGVTRGPDHGGRDRPGGRRADGHRPPARPRATAHVAHVTGPLEWVEAGQRRAGWRAAHELRGLLPGPELSGDWSASSGYAAGQRVADDRDVTAVFAANDAMALGVLKALHEHGREVPADVSVVGFDDVPEAAYFWPGLTTVNQEFSMLGRQRRRR